MDEPRTALLVLSFGGPESPEDVLPFLRNVTRGRDVPEERLAEVAEQYALFGGRSPLNDQCRSLMAAVTERLTELDWPLPVYWGNRNWHPLLADTVATMAADGITDAVVFVTSAFGSYSGCRQYREDLATAAAAVGPTAPKLAKLRLFYNHPGFIGPLAEHLRTALGAPPRPGPDAGPGPNGDTTADSTTTVPLPATTRLLFTAHSIPESMATGCDYVAQLHEASRLVVETAGVVGDDGSPADHELVFQSRSGPPRIPWLEPDINDRLGELADQGDTEKVVVVPIGFVSDHMEVLFDLDTQARATATGLGLDLVRVATVGLHPRFVEAIVDLAAERLRAAPRLSVGNDGPWPDECPADHCPAPARRRAEQPD